MLKNEKNINGKVIYVTKTKQEKLLRKAKKEEIVDLIISKEESRKRAEKMIEFLKLIHPQNSKGGYVNAIEIKQILRGEGASRTLDGYFNLYDLSSQKTLDILTERIEKTFKFSHCIYYSLYTYDTKKEVRVPSIDRHGNETFEHKRVYKITKENAVETSVLPLDFDNINEEQMRKYLAFFHKLDIKPIVIFTGYGYQMLILLKEPRKDKNTFKEFTQKLIELGLPVDSSIDNAAQVFRMPFSRNCKSFSSDFIQFKPNAPEAIETDIVEMSYERYDYKEVINKLDQKIKERLKDSESEDEATEKITEFEIVEQEVSENLVLESINQVNVNSEYRELEEYYLLNFKHLPEPIKEMLKGVEAGYRNSVRLFLTIELLNKYNLSEGKVREIILKQNELNKPPADFDEVTEDFERFIEKYSYYRQGHYNSDLQEKFGSLHEVEIKTDFRDIKIDNRLLKNFDKIDHKSVPIYLSFKILEFETDRVEFTQQEIADCLNISVRTVRRNLESLLKTSIVLKTKHGRSKGKLAKFRLNPFGRHLEGYTAISIDLAKNIIQELNHQEIVLYLYFLYKTRSMKKDQMFTTQEVISKELHLDRTYISKLTDELNNRKYIRKTTIKRENLTFKSTYTLLRK